MKIRCDFVTNSSSSSFVLCFDDYDSVESTIRSEYGGPKVDMLIADIFNNSQNIEDLLFSLGMEFDNYFDDDEWDYLSEKIRNSGFVSCVNYGDDIDGDLEHDVLPNLSCCAQIISHH